MINDIPKLQILSEARALKAKNQASPIATLRITIYPTIA
jgi:hypothetical protein